METALLQMLKEMKEQRQQDKEEADRKFQEAERIRKEEKEEAERIRKEEKEEAERKIQEAREDADKRFQALLKSSQAPTTTSATPNFSPFDSSSELWADYFARFITFVEANSIPTDKRPQVFLTNQTSALYKQLSNLAAQQQNPKKVNALTLDEIETFMKDQYDPKRFIVRERFKFWSEMQRKPGETIHELAARIRHDAATCDFPSIRNPQDEALRQRFICSVSNEAVLKALFKINDDQLTFAKAIEVAQEVEDAARVAKETAHGNRPKPVHKVKQHIPKNLPNSQNSGSDKSYTCYRCGKKGHKANECRHKDTTCNYCKVKGHLEAVCRNKQKEGPREKESKKGPCKRIDVKAVSNHMEHLPKLEVPVEIEGQRCLMEIDTATTGNFLSTCYWEDLGRPELEPATTTYESASKHELPVIGTFKAKTKEPGKGKEQHEIYYNVTDVPDLNLLGRDATKKIGISVDEVLHSRESCNAVFDHLTVDDKLRKDCKKLCEDFPELWKPGLGCLKDVELEVEFKKDAQPVFCKARPVPRAIQDDLEKAYEEGIAKGTWEYTQFNEYGTPVVPVKKPLRPGQKKSKMRVCGDYSVTVNSQLKEHRHPIPLPEDLMNRLGGGHGFTKIDLSDAYNQIKLGPKSQKRLALSTHKGVLLQKRLPFGIKSAPGYFQQIMDQLTQDLPGVAVYLDDLLISGKDAEDHLKNLRQLLQRLHEKGLRCRLEKCQFAEPYVEYLGHLLSSEGVAKGPKVNDLLKLTPPTDVSSLKSFLGSVQFYAKFLPPDLATITEPLYRLTKKKVQWTWSSEQETAFKKLKDLLTSENVLVHYNSKLPIGISCDASNVGIGAVLFHRYSDGSERPICNVSKILTSTQRNYSQIQKEALSIIFGLKKFYQFIYGRKFILVMDHRPLLAMFGPNKATPSLAANRLARWALMLSQFDYQIEYRRTKDHGNADVLSRLPTSGDTSFDGEESEEDIQMVCNIEEVSKKIAPADQNPLSRESAKDPIISSVIRHTREGWPPKGKEEGSEMQRYRQLAGSLAITNGCLTYGSRVIVPAKLRHQVLDQLHQGHLGMQRMKQLARTAVYWPNIDDDIEATCRQCIPCGEHQNKPPKPAIHPWMLPEKPWSRLHIDHAINFMGSNWLVLVDAYSKYPCIHPTQAVTAKATIELLEQDFAHFGYPHTLVTDNATTFMSGEFKSWCKERGITHLTGAPYHPSTNGAAERLVQTFKQSLRKSSLPPRRALQEFLMQYRRTPNSTGYSPSELLNSRQIRTKIDTLLPSPAHAAQGKQAREATKSQQQEMVAKVAHTFNVGDPVYALYFGPRRDKEARWVPAVVTKRKGSRTVNVKVYPRGPTWRRHLEQLQPRYPSTEDDEPGDEPGNEPTTPNEDIATTENTAPQVSPQDSATSPRHLPRRSARSNKGKPPDRFKST